MIFGNIFVWKFNVLEEVLFRNRHTTKQVAIFCAQYSCKTSIF